MDTYQTLIFLMTAAIILVGISQKLRIPYPVALVIGGCFIGFFPALSKIHIDPNLLLLVVLPPILYYAAFGIAFQEFKKNWRDIFSLALGLVFATTIVVGIIFKLLFPEFSWALAFAFGAIIAPPDAVAATSVLKRFGISSRLLTELEGESLINDASALVLYKLAVVALLSGSFSIAGASFEFIKIVLGGIAIGIVTGILIQKFSRKFLDPVVGVVFSFTIPYLTYILADSIGVSGVLAVVVNGLIGSRILRKHHSPLRRVLGYAAWDVFIILLNCLVFILIGSALPIIAGRMTSEEMIIYTGYGFLFFFVILAVRMTWVYADCALFYFHSLRKTTLKSKWHPNFRDACIIGWSGMRGIVSLAAALALPVAQPGGNISLPGRDAVIFITFVVIFLTLVIPGLTLPTIIRWLKVKQRPELEVAPHIREQLVKVAEEEIEQLRNEIDLSREEYNLLMEYFKIRHKLLEITFSSSGSSTVPKIELARKKVLQAQRQFLFQLWEEGEIDDKLLNTIEGELDVEEARMPRAVI